jgi:uncharacterized protein (DUF2062 family)
MVTDTAAMIAAAGGVHHTHRRRGVQRRLCTVSSSGIALRIAATAASIAVGDAAGVAAYM